jgi:multiple antibiotic resistance protein
LETRNSRISVNVGFRCGAITVAALPAGRAAESLLLRDCRSPSFVLVGALPRLFSASRLGRILGVTANVALSRLLCVLLAALAVQYVVDGIRVVLAG